MEVNMFWIDFKSWFRDLSTNEQYIHQRIGEYADGEYADGEKSQYLQIRISLALVPLLFVTFILFFLFFSLFLLII